MALCLMQLSNVLYCETALLCLVTHVKASCLKLMEIAWLEPLLVAKVTPVTDDVDGDVVDVTVLALLPPRSQNHLYHAKGNLQRRLVRENRDGGLSG